MKSYTKSVWIQYYSDYIPLRRKTIHVGPLHWAISPMREFCIRDTNMLVSKTTKICVTPNVNAKICITPKQTQYANRWNIGGVFVPNAKFSQCEGGFQWNMHFTIERHFGTMPTPCQERFSEVCKLCPYILMSTLCNEMGLFEGYKLRIDKGCFGTGLGTLAYF